LDGKAISQQIRDEITEGVADFIENNGIVPGLAAVLVGDDPFSERSARAKGRACESVGIESRLHRLPADSSEDDLLAMITRLNNDVDVHGVVVHLPLPAHIRPARVLDAVHPLKDVEAFHPENVGRMLQGRPRFLPCAAHGIQQILHRSGIEVSGKHAVVIGRGEMVGRPLAAMLSRRNSTVGPTAASATVTVCHSRTSRLADITRLADILIVAVGRPKFVTPSLVREGSVVVDAGMNRTEDGLVGDVDFDAVREVAGHITPVPGGVGPLTVAMLLYNTLAAAHLQTTPSC
jgi:methylenetetrahydrofolate dehydrogenase (NADP+)/methenyltetrahydrofolate cyclohydrolase